MNDEENPGAPEFDPALEGVHTVADLAFEDIPAYEEAAPAEEAPAQGMRLVISHASGEVSEIPVAYGKVLQIHGPNGVEAGVAFDGVTAIELVH